MNLSIVRRIRASILTALFVLGFTSFTRPTSLHAQIGKAGHEFIYYSDATHTKEVGFWIFCSNGQQFRSGQITQYSVIVDSGC